MVLEVNIFNEISFSYTEYDPDCAAYYANRSAALMMVEDFNKALDDARHAFTLDSSFVKAYLRAAKCYIATGQTIFAMTTLQTAENLEPKNKSIQQEVVQFIFCQYYLCR